MLFQVGHFYMHNGGRQIAVIGEVKSYRWDRMLVIEEADKTGHSISCVDAKEDLPAELWTTIGRDEWLRNFGGEQ